MTQTELDRISRRFKDTLREIAEFDARGMLFMRLGLSEILYLLTPKERCVLDLRFGMAGNGTKTLKETGQYFGITSERARQTEQHALNNFKYYLKQQLDKEDLKLKGSLDNKD